MLETLIPTPRKIEVESVDLEAGAAVVWNHIRHGNLVDSPLARALFALRTLPGRFGGAPLEPVTLCLDQLQSTPEHPGFRILGDEAPREVTVGAIGKVWQLDIPFVHVESPEAYARFAEPGFVKVAWSIRLEPLGDAVTRLAFELRVDATDEASWKLFARYWHVIGPGSHFVRHTILAALRRRFGVLDARDERRALAGDALLGDAAAELTHGISINAPPEAIWPWLVQMGCRRGGFYAIDLLDNGGRPSAREVHPELQKLSIGDVIPSTPEGTDGFEVLDIEACRALILGGLFDVDADKQLRFSSPRPTHFWHMTWAFVLEPIDPKTTRLHVRARAAFSPSERLHVAWIRPVHALMQTSQLRHLAARAEGRLAQDTLGDVGAGIAGAAIMTLAWLTPFLRPARTHWGLSEEEANQPRPGDELITEPLWSWTHAVDVEASSEEVWPWLLQIGADRGGFYSYQWLENLTGCNVRNAERIHPEWAHQVGSGVVLHPKIPPLRVVSVDPPLSPGTSGSFVAFAPPDEAARTEGRPWAAASWAFLVEPLGVRRCRVVSRFRSACSSDLATRLAQGPTLLEPIGFAMDRKMLLGIRERVSRTATGA